MKLTLLCIFIFSLSAFSQEEKAPSKIKIYWNCYLPNNEVSCVELEASFKDANADFTFSAADEAQLLVGLRSITLDNSVEYQYEIEGAGNLPEISFKYPLNSTLTPDEKFEKVLSMMNKLTDPYKLILNNGSNTTSESKKPYYVSPNVNGFGQRGASSTNLSGSASVIANYSNKDWRFVGITSVSSNFNSQKTTAFNTGYTTLIFSYAGGAGAVRSLNDHWHLAVVASDNNVSSQIKLEDPNIIMDPNALKNTARKTTIKAGAEWLLIPFTTEKSNGNISARYSISAEFHKYVDPKSFAKIEEQFAKHLVELNFTHHFDKIDVNMGVSAFTSSFRSVPLSGLSGTTGFSWRISPRMTAGMNVSVDSAKGRVLSPAEGNGSFSSLTGATVGKTVFFNGNVSIKYTIGNTRLFKNEQRWKEYNNQ